jgi:hypothetical protein
VVQATFDIPRSSMGTLAVFQRVETATVSKVALDSETAKWACGLHGPARRVLDVGREDARRVGVEIGIATRKLPDVPQH